MIGASTTEDVNKLIDEWLDSSPSPQADDLEMIVQYFTSVMDYGDVSHVYDVIRFMLTKIEKVNNQKWKDACEKVIINTVNEKLRSVHGPGANLPF